MLENKNGLSDVYITCVSSEEDIETTAKLAENIWEEHYTPIIGSEQVKYMVDNFQTSWAISNSIKEGCIYYIVWLNDIAAGYFAIKENEPQGRMFLSKFYVERTFRGKGLASIAMKRIVDMAKAKNLESIWLTVNKNNTNSIKIYEKFGFVKVKSILTPIGSNFFMDDYVMEFILNS